MTDIRNMANEITRQLQYYATDVKEKVEDAKQETATVLKKNIAQDSPKRRPKYAKGWRIKKVGKSLVVHNKTDYQLTHLLEHGYVKKNGERQAGQIHIRPNEEHAIRDYLEKIERAIQP